MQRPVVTLLDTDFLITRATSSDRRQLIRFWERLDISLPATVFESSPAGKKKFYQKLARQITRMEHGFALIARHKKEPAGCICAHLYDKPESTRTPVGIVYNLWVEPPMRRQGLATALAAEAETRLQQLGAQGMQVAWRQDPTAEHFWRSRGYAAYETLAGKSVDPIDPAP